MGTTSHARLPSRSVGDPSAMNPSPTPVPAPADEADDVVDLASVSTAVHPVAKTAASVPLTEPARHADPVPGDRLGQYRLLRELGAGGMGLVFEAEDEWLNRRVAVKVLRSDLPAEQVARERFLREARAMAAVEHDNVVHHLPGRRGRRPAVPGHAAPGRGVAGGPARPRAPARRSPRPPASAARSPRAGRRPREGAGPPRHQAGQHLARSAGRAGSSCSTSAWPGPRQRRT